MEKADTDKPTLRSFIFVSGYGKHEQLYDVSNILQNLFYHILCFDSMPNILVNLGLESIGLHFLMRSYHY
jgi:hypothetical protein